MIVEDDMQEIPPFWVFEIDVDEKPQARVFGEEGKRNWVLWKLSQYVIALEDKGAVTVRQLINGEWKDANDWRNLAH